MPGSKFEKSEKMEKDIKINKKLTKHTMSFIFGRYVGNQLPIIFYKLVSMETDHVTIYRL